jgi:hypothetical protein
MGSGGHCRDRRCIHELGAAALAAVHHQEILPRNLDLVPMKDGSRLGAQTDAIHQGVRIGSPPLNDGAPFGGAPQNGVAGLNPLAGKDYPSGGVRADSQFAGGYLITPPAELELHHVLDS